jgi:hypothetical protein
MIYHFSLSLYKDNIFGGINTMDIEFNVLNKVKIAFERIPDFYLQYLKTKMINWDVYDKLLNKDKNEWTTWMSDRGTLYKRFANELYKGKRYAFNDLEYISQVSRLFAAHGKQLYFEFRKKSSWSPGSFKEYYDSCWWTRYRNAKKGLIEHGGFSVLFYENQEEWALHKGIRGIGRCWAYPIKDRLYIFNGYGFETQLIVQAIAQLLNLTYRPAPEFNPVKAWVSGAYVLSKTLLVPAKGAIHPNFIHKEKIEDE